MKKSASISDVIFAFFIGFLVSLCLFRYYGIPLVSACILAVLCGGFSAYIAFCILRAKRKKLFLKKSDEKTRDRLFLHLALSTDEENTAYFQRILSTKSPTKRIKRLQLSNETDEYFLRLHLSPVTADQALTIAKTKTQKQKNLFCIRLDDEADRVCHRFDITVKTGEYLFAFLKEASGLPEKYLGDETPEKKRKRHAKLWLAKSNSKRFFVSGTILLLLSLFTPFPFYYLLFGIGLFLVSLLVKIFGYD